MSDTDDFESALKKAAETVRYETFTDSQFTAMNAFKAGARWGYERGKAESWPVTTDSAQKLLDNAAKELTEARALCAKLAEALKASQAAAADSKCGLRIMDEALEAYDAVASEWDSN